MFNSHLHADKLCVYDPIRSKNTEDIIKTYLTGVYSTFRGSKYILSDCRSEFTSKQFDFLAKELGFPKICTSPYTPTGNSIIEHTHYFLAHDRMSVASLCNHDLSVVIVIVICEHSSWPHAWPNKVHTLHAHAAISCIVAHQKLYHSDLYLLHSSHICMFILMSIVHEIIHIVTSNLTKTCI